MPRLLSNRKPVSPPSKLTDDRFKYLGLSQAQPALGPAPTPNEGYTIKTDGDGKATFSNTLGQLKFENQIISTTLPGDMAFTATNGNIVISPLVKAQVTGDLEVLENIIVKGDNPLGTGPVVSNILYVTMDGDDRNDGRALDASRACRTISGAVRSPYYKEGTVIKVASGHYFEENPIPLKGYTCVIGDDLRTTFVEALNKDLDLFHVNSGVYIAQMQMRNLRRGSVERYAPGGAGTYTTGAYCVAFPPKLEDPIDVYFSPYVQNCTNQTGPWLKDGTMFVPNQTVQIPQAAGVASWTGGQTSVTVTLTTGTIVVGQAVNDAANEGYRNAQLLLQANKTFLQHEVVAFVEATYQSLEYNQDLCFRDVGLIVEAVAGDARFGGNQRSLIAALSYWDGATSLIPGETAETVAAINYLESLCQAIIVNNPILSTYQGDHTQIINANYDKGNVVSTRLTTLFSQITDIIGNGISAEPERVLDLYGLIYPTGLSPNQTNVASTVTSVVDNGNGTFTIGLSTSTVSASDNATIYFGETSTYPYLDADIPTEWTVADADGIFADRRLDPHGAGGGALVDGNAPSSRSPIQSFVFDAFTQVCQGGHGIHIINNGYAQLVSVFTLFCDQAVTVENGGIASITNSNANFGDLCLVAKGLGKLDFSGIIWNPAYPTNVENGEFYPLGYWPQAGRMEVFIPNDRNRPHIGQVMEVVPPDTYLDYNGNRVPYVNEQGYPGYLVATSNTSTVNTGSYTLSGIDTSNIAVGHTLYIRDIYGESGPNGVGSYITPGAQVTDVNYQEITLDQPILNGGGDESNPNYLNLYFCGNAYYTVLSSIIDESLSRTGTEVVSVIPGEITTTSQAIAYARDIALQIIANETVTPLQTDTVQVIDTDFSTGEDAAGAVAEKFNRIIEVITGGSTSTYQINGQIAKTDQSVLDAKKLLEKNRNFIQAQTVAYTDTLWPSRYSYNADICARDTGLIVDAIAQDLLFGGTSQSTFAAIQYWGQGDSFVPNESYYTKEAISYLKTLAEQVVTNTTSTRYQSTVTQVLAGGVATNSESATIGDNFDTILNIFNDGIAGITDTIVPNNLTASSDVNVITAYNKLQANKSFFANEIIAFVNSNKGFTYNSTACSRDTGLLVDAVALDLLYPTDTDSQSTFAAIQYYNHNGYTGQIEGEITTTTNAINHLKDLAKEVVQNLTSGVTRYTTLEQVTSLPAATLSEADTLGEKFDVIVNILTTGTTGVTDIIVPNGNASTDDNLVNAYNLLIANKDYLKEEVIAYIDATRSGNFTYDKVKCARDTGLVVDAVVQDLLFNGETQTTFSGVQYWNHGSYTGKIAGELNTTTNAINYVKDLAKKVIVNVTTGTRYQSTVSQVISGTPATTAEQTILENEFSIVTDILTSGIANITDDIVPNNIVASSTASIVNAYNNLQANKAYIQAEAIAYVESIKSYKYDEAKCLRDTGLIIDAVVQDLLFGGQTQSTFAGVQYWNHGSYIGEIASELTTTTNAINYLKTLTRQIVINQSTGTRYQSTVTQDISLPAATAAEQSLLNTEFGLITTILNDGVAGVTDLIVPNEINASTTESVQNAYALLQANKAYIEAEVVAYVESTKTPGFVYDQTKCARDVGYMVDSVSFDILYGGNLQAIRSGVYYYSFNELSTALPGEQTQSVAAYNYLKSLLPSIIKGTDIGTTYQTSVSQITAGRHGTTEQVTVAQNLIDVISEIIIEGPAGADAGQPIGLVRSDDTDIINAANMIYVNRDFLTAEIVAYVNNQIAYNYDAAKCYRDVGYIVDSISFDLLYGGNLQAIESGVYYYGFNENSTAIPGEQSQAVDAYNYIKSLIPNIVTGTAITGTYQVIVSQVTSGSYGTSAESTTAQGLMDNITDIIVNGPDVANSGEPIGLTKSVSSNVINAATMIHNNRAFLVAEAIAYIDTTYSTGTFTYNEKKCQRDTGIIIDDIILDLFFGGTSQSTFAGLQYWNQNGYTGDISNEITTTTNAINYVSELAQKVVINDTTGVRYSGGTQITNLIAAASSAEATTIEDEFALIVDVLTNGTAGITDRIVANNVDPSTNDDVVNAYNLLMANRAYIQAEAVAWVEANKEVGYSYDQSACSRDVGYIIDSVAFDVLHGGNRQAIQSGVYYFNFDATSSAVPNEEPEVIAAFNYLKSLVSNVITATPMAAYQTKVSQDTSLPAATGSEVTALHTKINNIVNIITNGPSVAPTKTPITQTPSSNANVRKAVNLLLANKDFIKAELISWINQTNGVYTYDQDKCARDVGYMLDSVAFDLLHGGNRQSIQSGVAYYGYNASSNSVGTELPQVNAAYNRLKSVIRTIITGGTVRKSTSNTASQVTGYPLATTAEADAFDSKIDYILDVINSGPSAANTLMPVGLDKNTSVYAQRAFNILVANRDFIREEIVAYVNDNFANFNYDSTKCARDVGYMIDSVSFDLLYSGNRQSIQSGVYYYEHDGSATAIPGEIPQTTAAYNFIKELMADIIIGNEIVDPQQNLIKQVITGSNGTLAELATAEDIVDNITNIINNGPSVAPSPTNIPLTPSLDSDVQAASAALLANKEFIKAEVIAFIGNTYHTQFMYDETLCSRDTGLIVDALAQDLMFGGSSQSTFAGIQYWGQGTTVIPGELTTTTNAINYASLLAQKVIKNDTSGYRYQNTVTQVTNLTSATTAEATLIARDFNVITDIIKNGTVNITDSIVPNGLDASTNTNVVRAYNILRANREYIQNEVVAYVDATANFQYDENKCFRDVGLLIDSMAFDILYPTTADSQTTFAAIQYWNHGGYTGAISSEITTTTNSLVYLSSLAQKVAVGNTGGTRYQYTVGQTTSTNVGTNSEAASIGNNFGAILDILSSGPGSVTDAVVSNGRATNTTSTVNAYNLLLANKDYMVAEVIAYVESTKSVGYVYDQTLCRRDVGYIVDSIAFDLLHGGNRQSIQSGTYYYGYSTTSTAVPNEVPQVTAAYNYMKEVIASVVQGIEITPSSGNNVNQVTYMLPASSAEVTKLSNLVTKITNIINNGPGQVTTKTPIALTASTNENADRAFDLLIANREFIQTEITSWINNNFCGFEYDKAKCYRDVGYMVDSVSTDLLYGGNRQAIQSGVYYYGFNGADTQVPNEIPQVTAAYSFIGNIVGDIVSGVTIATPQQNKVAQVTTVASNYYNQAKCERDTGILIDSMIADLVFGDYTNSFVQSNFSGLQYWSQNGYTGAIAAELTTTTNAINYLKTIAQQIVTNNTGTRYQSTVTQVTNLTTATSAQATRIATDFAVITDIITNGTTGVTDKIVASGISVVSQDAQHAYDLLEANKDYMIAEVVAYVDTVKSSGFTYDKSLCARDVGYIIDSVGFDVLYGGNRQAIQSGVYYYGYSTSTNVVASESTQTVAAYTRLNEILPLIVTNQNVDASPFNSIAQDVSLPTATETEGSELRQMLNLITDIIVNGPTSAQDKTPIRTTASTNTNVSKAVAILQANKEFIVNEVVAYINHNYLVGTDAEAQQIRNNISLITNIINNGPDVATNITSLGTTATSNVNAVYAARLLDANRDFIRAETIAYINNVYDTGFKYNEASCYRDTGLIIDSIALDMLYDGVSQSAFSGLQYWDQGDYTGQIGAEITTTTNAVRYLREIAQKVVLGEEVDVTDGNTGTQTITVDLGSEIAASNIANNLTTIINILTNGKAGVTDAIVTNGNESADEGILNAYALLQANKEFMQQEVVARINADNPYYDYDQALCYRDVGYILDCVAFDLLRGGNRQSIQAGVYYWGFDGTDSVIKDESEEVASAYEYLRKVVSYVVTGQELPDSYQDKLYQNKKQTVAQITDLAPGTLSEVSALQSKVDVITDIIKLGPTAAPTKTPIGSTANGSTNVVNAYNIIMANKEFIQAEVIAYTTYNYTYVPTYNKNKCYRDMGTIVDAVIYDTLYGGTYRSTNAGNGYYYRKGQYHIITLEQNVLDPTLFIDGATVNFYQQSYISASGYLFEYVGAGTQYGALPQVGFADPVQSKETVQLNNGKVFFTSTDQNGDFRIGPTLVISQSTGILSGRTFQKSLYAEMTPFILVIGA